MIPITDWLLRFAVAILIVIMCVFFWQIGTRLQPPEDLAPWERPDKERWVHRAYRKLPEGAPELLLISVLYMLGMTVADKLFGLPRATARMFLGTAAIGLASVILFALRNSHLRTYAVLEIAFALATAMTTMKSLGDEVEPAQLIGVMTAVYLMIRGFDNYKRDLDERRKMKEHPPVNT